MKKPARPAKKAPPRKKTPPSRPKASPKARAARRPAAKPVKVRPKPKPAAKSVRRRAPGPAVAAKPVRLGKAAPARVEPRPVERDNGLKEQVKVFEAAMRLFNRGDFKEARDLYRKAAAGPNREMAHTAAMHINMCDRRLSRDQPAPKTPEELYAHGVALMNQARLDEAADRLEASLQAREAADHVHYALALCLGLQGKLDAAARHLQRAVDLRPLNRQIARGDPEFQPIANRPPLRVILYPEKVDSG
jgi:tetratricopeptide (TPR) repeat protein